MRIRPGNKIRFAVFIVASVVVLALAGIGIAHVIGPAGGSAAEKAKPGAIEKVGDLGVIPKAMFAPYLAHSGMADQRISALVTTARDVRLFQICYRTTNYDGKTIVATGLAAVPMTGAWRGVVSYQHGTITDSRTAPSAASGSADLLYMMAHFAAGGYVFIAPDYIGLGGDDGIHPYMHAESSANAVIDLLRAVRALTAERFDRPWPKALFLYGISQGGYVTMAAHRALQELNEESLTVTASAPVAGAYNLAGISTAYTLGGSSPLHTMLLGYVLHSYSVIYQTPLDTLIKPEHAELLCDLYDGTTSFGQIMTALPGNPRDLLLPEFLADLENGRKNRITNALSDNEVYDWLPRAPMRLYYCGQDTMVSPEESRFCAAFMSERGAPVEAVSLGDFDHFDAVRAVPLVRLWFDELSE